MANRLVRLTAALAGLQASVAADPTDPDYFTFNLETCFTTSCPTMASFAGPPLNVYALAPEPMTAADGPLCIELLEGPTSFWCGTVYHNDVPCCRSCCTVASPPPPPLPPFPPPSPPLPSPPPPGSPPAPMPLPPEFVLGVLVFLLLVIVCSVIACYTFKVSLGYKG